MTCKPSKLGQIDLAFGLCSEIVSRSVHAGLQVSMSVVANKVLSLSLTSDNILLI